MSIFEAAKSFVTQRLSPAAAAGRRQADSDNRLVTRHPQRMRSGFIWSQKLITARPCQFKDLSVRGARVEILGEPIRPGLLAEGLLLYFDTEKHEVPCSVAWVKGRVVGLKFEGRPRSPSRTYR